MSFIGSSATNFEVISDPGRVPEVGAVLIFWRTRKMIWYRLDFDGFISGLVRGVLMTEQSNRANSLTCGTLPLTTHWRLKLYMFPLCLCGFSPGTSVSSNNLKEKHTPWEWSEPLIFSGCEWMLWVLGVFLPFALWPQTDSCPHRWPPLMKKQQLQRADGLANVVKQQRCGCCVLL